MLLSPPSVWLNLILILELWCKGPNGSVIVTLVLNFETEEAVKKLLIPELDISVVSCPNLIDLETELESLELVLLIPTLESPNVSISIGVNTNWVLGVSFTNIVDEIPEAVVNPFSPDGSCKILPEVNK